MRAVQVIGGGFSGLCMAYFLSKQGHPVRLVETAPRFGGLLGTEILPEGVAETAANALISSELVESVAQEIGIELMPTLPSAKKRFIFRNGKMRRLPLSTLGKLRLFLAALPKFFLAKSLMAPRKRETISEWGERNLGREGLAYLLTPALSGIYAGRSSELSASLILGRFFKRGPKGKSGKLKGSVAPRQGMEEWPRAFRKALTARGVTFAFEPKEDLPTIVTLPPPKAAEFLRERAPALVDLLSQIEMLSLLSVTLFLPASAPGIEGFGCLFPRTEGFRVLGILANDRIFPDRVAAGFRSETWIFGGATDPEVVNFSDAEIETLITAERAKLFSGPAPLRYSIHRWPRAIPHYNITLEALLPLLSGMHEGKITLFGTYMGNLGLARVMAQAESLARSFA